MIYSDKLWQSINETNHKAAYLQFCRAKAYYQFRIHLLLEAVDLTLLTLQDPRRLLYTLCKSSSSYNCLQCPKSRTYILVCQPSFRLGQPLANYPFALASLWPTTFLHWPAFGQWFYMNYLFSFVLLVLLLFFG